MTNVLASKLPTAEREAIESFLEDSSRSERTADGGTATPGGIDLRRLPIKTETGISFPAKVRMNTADDPILDAQWQEIQGLVNKGFLPEPGRIKEWLSSCMSRGELPPGIESVLACLADILRMEEDLYLPTDPDLKELLVLLESA